VGTGIDESTAGARNIPETPGLTNESQREVEDVSGGRYNSYLAVMLGFWLV
jgi:hypothetical protein